MCSTRSQRGSPRKEKGDRLLYFWWAPASAQGGFESEQVVKEQALGIVTLPVQGPKGISNSVEVFFAAPLVLSIRLYGMFDKARNTWAEAGSHLGENMKELEELDRQ